MRLRDPRYTGSNRCRPCTILNVALLAVVAGALVAVGAWPVAAGVVLVGGLAVALRGYVVPGTPAIGRRLPEPIRTRFGHDDTVRSGPAATALFESGVLTEDLELGDRAANRLLPAALDLVDDRERLASEVRSRFEPVEEVSVNRALDGGEHWLALDAQQATVRQWEARPVVALDVAAAGLLADAAVAWDDKSPRERDELLALVRYGTPRCPACGETFRAIDDDPVACCGGRSLVGERRCEHCGYALIDRNDLPDEAVEGERADDGEEGDDSRDVSITSGAGP